MATLPEKIRVESRMRDLLEAEGMQLPDRVEYGYGGIRLFWTESKVVVVVDIDDYSEIDADRGMEPHEPRRSPAWTAGPAAAVARIPGVQANLFGAITGTITVAALLA